MRMRGRSCPKAWVSLVPERVCPEVLATSNKSLVRLMRARKSWHASKNLPPFKGESLREWAYTEEPEETALLEKSSSRFYESIFLAFLLAWFCPQIDLFGARSRANGRRRRALAF